MPNPESNLKAEFIYTVIFIGLNGSILLKPGIEKKKKITFCNMKIQSTVAWSAIYLFTIIQYRKPTN